ncbi:MAG: TetR/AcrR family transcriptional regulator [Myxococcota bacterium]
MSRKRSKSTDEADDPGGRHRDPEGVRARTLQAAVMEFSEKGYEAASLRAIGRRAEVSQPLISYHFGSKEGLWKAVKAEVVTMARTSLMREVAKRADAVDRVEAAMVSFFAHAKATPEARRVGLWAQLRGGEEFEGEASMLKVVTELVKQVQAQGKLRPDVPAEHLVWSFRSAVYEWIGNRDRICAVFGWDPDDPAVDERFLETLRRMGAPYDRTGPE